MTILKYRARLAGDTKLRDRIVPLALTMFAIVLGVARPAVALDGMSSTLLAGQSLSLSGAGSDLNVLGPFNIVLSFNDAPTPAESAAFTAAEATWESLILGYQEDVGSATITISVNLDPIDGPGGILGSAGPTTAKGGTATFLYSNTGVMTFDTADTAALGAALGDVILHEMGHVLGIGTLWSSSGAGIPGFQELYVSGSGAYTGAFGLAAYNAEFAQVGASVPVELGGGGGTANAHWNEVDGGAGLTGIVNGGGQDMRNELMTGWLNAPSFISDLTVQSMRDLGYNVVPEPSSFVLMFAGIAALSGYLLRKRRAA